jgi:predicted AAA+ superfamily ATPase
MDINIFNPWWRTGEVPPGFTGRKRKALKELLSYLDLRQIIILYGLRGAGKTTLMFQISNLANDLEHDQRTVSDYISYLEYALLIDKLYNFSPNRLTSEKKLRRVYLKSTAFSSALSGESDLSSLAEQYFANTLKAGYFWRSPQKDEVDLILTPEKKVIPVGIKIRGDIRVRDAKPIFKFMTKYGIERGYIISSGLETSFEDGGRTVEVLPYWRHWTIRRKLSE